jgi:DNA-binding protein HU-beta
MNKGDLIAAVAKDLGGSKAQAEKAVNSVLDSIKKNVKKGVNIIGFGSFVVGTAKRAWAAIRRPARPSRSRPQRPSVSKPARPLIGSSL